MAFRPFDPGLDKDAQLWEIITLDESEEGDAEIGYQKTDATYEVASMTPWYFMVEVEE